MAMEALIGVLSFMLTSFGLGYAIGYNHGRQNKK